MNEKDMPFHFSDDDAAFLTAIASQGSFAIENALAYQSLAKLDQMKSSFVRTVTHELRSPVSVVRSLLRAMLAGYVGSRCDSAIASRLQRLLTITWLSGSTGGRLFNVMADARCVQLLMRTVTSGALGGFLR